MYRHISRLACAVSLLWAVAAQAQTVDEIVAKNLQAKGGAQKWQAVSSVKMSGKMMVQGQEMPLTVYAKRPNLNRQEVALPDGAVVQAFDGTTAWMINPRSGSTQPQPVPGAPADMMKNAADFDGALINYKTKGHKIELVGKETLGGQPVYHLKVTMKGGQVQDYFLDAESGIELKTSAQVDFGMGAAGGKMQTLDTEMSNYKAIDGIMIPHTIKQFMNGNQMVQMSISSVEFNTPIDDAMFSMPKK
jgi:outer membrane lipoprotein-sorting protein